VSKKGEASYVLSPVSSTSVINLPPVSTTLLINLSLRSVSDTGHKFMTCISNTIINLSPVLTTRGGMAVHFMTGVADTSNKFMTSVNDTGHKSLDTKISAIFKKNLNGKMALSKQSEPWGKLNHIKKKPKISCPCK